MLGKLIAIITCSLAVVLGAATSKASAPSSAQAVGATEQLRELVRKELAKRNPGARIELISAIRWNRSVEPAAPESVAILNENQRGEALFSVRSGEDYAEGTVGYAAWAQAHIAKRRILPNEKLSPELFSAQDVNVAAGSAREYRGVILPVDTNLSELESRQTILEGQMALSTAVQKMPNIRRGDPVRIHLISNGLTLSTSGTAEEPGYTDGQIRVLSTKTKRALVGKLLADKTVEVKL